MTLILSVDLTEVEARMDTPKRIYSSRSFYRSIFAYFGVGLSSFIAISGCSSKVSDPSVSDNSALTSTIQNVNLPVSIGFHNDEAPLGGFLGSAASTSAAPLSEISNEEGHFSLDPLLPSPPGSETSPGNTGTFSLSITDAPIDGLSAINVVFRKIELKEKKTQKKISVNANPVSVNLLNLQNGLSQAFGSLLLTPGSYSQLRFFFSSVSIVLNGVTVDVPVPHELAEDGAPIYGSFDIIRGSSQEFVIDFEASKLLVWSARGPIFRPFAKIRHIHFKPAGIHFVEQNDGTMSLVGPAQTVRARTWLLLTEVSGKKLLTRASRDGSFVFNKIPKIFGKVELAVLVGQGESGYREHREDGRHEDLDEDQDDENRRYRYRASEDESDEGSHEGEHQDGEHDDGEGHAHRHRHWSKLASIKIVEDFRIDPRFPRILASHVDALFGESFAVAHRDPSTFLNLFGSSPFQFLAANFLMAEGFALPNGYAVPNLAVPYSFALEGPDYELPSYTFAENAVGFYSGGPTAAGCSDAKTVFEGNAPANQYAGLNPDQALAKMLKQGLPFTGLLAEFETTCRARDLATLSCSTLGGLYVGGTATLPADPLLGIEKSLNSPRGGIITALLACVRPNGPILSGAAVPVFPDSATALAPQCWYGCGGETSESYVAATALLNPGATDRIIPDASLVSDLDSLVKIADQFGVNPLVLLASFVADRVSTKAHGYVDRNAPLVSNLLPQTGLVTLDSSVNLSGSVSDRSTQLVTINGVTAPFELGADGQIRILPLSVGLSEGDNLIDVAAMDLGGNVGHGVVHVSRMVIHPSPLPSPSPSPSPTVAGVSSLCSDGNYVPKGAVKLGISTDTSTLDTQTTAANIQAGFQNLGYASTLYTNAEIASKKPIADGITVLVISRVVTLNPLTPDFISGLKSYLSSGGSLMGEYDGAAVLFDQFSGTNPAIPNLTPALSLYSGMVTGGGVLLPISNSTMYVSDPNDPIMQGVPPSFLQGPRASFAVSGQNGDWLHTSGTFVSSGYMGLIPAGTFPAVMSGRCGAGRVVLFTMNDFSILNLSPVNTMVNNALQWLISF